MAYISDEHRLAFFAAPATGSSAIIKCLADREIGQYWPEENIIENGRRLAPKKHSTLPQLEAAGIDGRIAGYVKAVGVRNMFSWHVAKYLRNRTSRQKNVKNKNSWIYRELTEVERDRYIKQMHEQMNMTFGEYLHSTLDRHDAIDIHQDFHDRMDVYIHQESLSDDFDRLAQKIGLPSDIRVPKFNVTGAMESGQTYRDFYSPDLVEYLYEKHAPFFARFPEYSFERYDEAIGRERRKKI